MNRRNFLKLPIAASLAMVIPAKAKPSHQWVKMSGVFPAYEYSYPWFDADEQYGWYIESPSPTPPDVLLENAYEVIPEGFRHKIDIISKQHPFRPSYTHAWKYTP